MSVTLATTNPTVHGAIAGIDPSGAETASFASNVLTAYSTYYGIVSAVNLKTQRLSVNVNKVVLNDCQYATGAIAAYMGVSNVQLPAVGAQVVVVYIPGNPMVIGVRPDTINDPDWYPGVVAGDVTTEALEQEGFQSGDTGEMPSSMGIAYPGDMVPGEQDTTNGIGSALRLLFNFAQMSAGGLALVETHLLNDMVRVVSNYFVHHNCGGDDMIWSNGRCNSESHFTGYPHEAEGKLSEDDPLAVTYTEGVLDPVGSCENTFSDTGRWRKSTYIGFLADMIHTWVTDPTEVISNSMEDAARAGKYRSWVGSDGMVMVQSVAGIHLEVAPKVVVPTINVNWNDPEFDAEDALKKLDASFLKIWGKGPDWKDLKVSVWQMRCYAKYITLWHSLQRWRQMEKSTYCTIPTEAESPEPEMTCKEEDKEKENPDCGSVPGGYASISVLPDGSISILTGDTASIVLNQGNIQLNAPGNIEINAGGTISLTGKSISAKAIENVEVVSIAGALYLKARSAWNALCEKGRMWLKSDAPLGGGEDGEWPADGGSPIPAEMKDCGIILDAVSSKALVSGAEGTIVTASAQEAKVVLQTTGGAGEVAICSPMVKVVATTSYLLKTAAWAVSSSVSKIASTVIKLGEKILITGGLLTVDSQIKAKSVAVTGAYLSDFKYNAKPKDPIELEVENDTADGAGDEAAALRDADIKEDVDKTEFKGVKWSLPEWKVPTDIEDPASIKAGATIDRGLAEPDWLSDNFYEVEWSKCKLEPATRTDSKNLPWPGSNARYFEFKDTIAPPLGKQWEMQFTEDDIKKASDMQLKPYRILIKQ